jgi:hypothetical protein
MGLSLLPVLIEESTYSVRLRRLPVELTGSWAVPSREQRSLDLSKMGWA